MLVHHDNLSKKVEDLDRYFSYNSEIKADKESTENEVEEV